jgi:uncharacterized membrane protein
VLQFAHLTCDYFDIGMGEQWASLMQELAQVFRQVDTHAALQLNALLCCACELIYFGRSTHMYSYMSISPAAVDLVHECWTNQQPS